MTVTEPSGAPALPVPDGHVPLTIDGIATTAPKGTLIIRAAEQLGIEIPRFCDHPLLDPVAACRMCLIEIEGQPKPQPACAIPVAEGMVVRTQHTSQVADAAQKGVMEFLLVNHPLDCPICDKGGECPLQNQAMSAGRPESRFEGAKRTFPKPINVSAQILLDRERCVSCARCTRFADEIAGDAFIDLLQRGAQQQVGISGDTPFDSYFSGNTVQICPVGALTSADYRFRARPFDLVSVPTACEHCASGCALRTDIRRGVVTRRLAWEDPAVNEDWNCDKGRFGFRYLTDGRLTHPLIKQADGSHRVASWPEALGVAADALTAAVGSAAVLSGGRLTCEDAYAYSKFARSVLATDDVDFRARAHSDEEAAFLAACVAGSGQSVSYADLESAPAVVLVGLEPEEESPILFLRLRKAAKQGTKVWAVSSWASPGLTKAGATVLAAVPGDEASVLLGSSEVAAALAQPGAVLLVGERAATSPGCLSAAAAVAAKAGAALAWVPRRAGERGALDAGLLPGVLPGARDAVAAAWGELPATGVGMDGVLARIAESQDAEPAEGEEAPEPAYRAVVLAGLDPADLPGGAEFVRRLAQVPFVLALATHRNAATEVADVVLPVAAVTEKAGTYRNWEGRDRSFPAVFKHALTMSDGEVLAAIADEMVVDFTPRDPAGLRAEMAGLGRFEPPEPPVVPPAEPQDVPAGQAVLASWRQLLDAGVMQAGEPYMAATARPAVARISGSLASDLGLADGDQLTVSTPNGAITLPVQATDMPLGTVWLPMNAESCDVVGTLGAVPGDIVRLAPGGAS